MYSENLPLKNSDFYNLVVDILIFFCNNLFDNGKHWCMHDELIELLTFLP